jgi:hypothetical protein
MSEANRQTGESQILEIARRVAEEFTRSHDANIRVIGWIGSTGQQGWEFAVEVNGNGFNLEVGESQVIGISSDEVIRREVEERIRNQMRYAVSSQSHRTPPHL